MSDSISARERAAIDAAVAAGKVRRIARGTGTIPVGAITGGGKKRGHLIIRPGQTLDEAEFVPADLSLRMKRAQAAVKRGKAERAADRARGDRVGQQPAQQPKPKPTPKPRIARATAPRRRGPPNMLRPVYERMVAEGLTQRQMAERLDRSLSTIRNNLDRYELRAAPGESGVTREAKRRRDVNIALYRDMVARGLTAPEMAAETGRDVTTVRTNLSRYGLKAAKAENLGGARHKGFRRHPPERAERIREMMLAGAEAREIAAEIRVSGSRVYQIGSEMGLSAAWREARERRQAAAAGGAGQTEEIAPKPVQHTASDPAAPSEEITRRGRPPAPSPSQTCCQGCVDASDRIEELDAEADTLRARVAEVERLLRDMRSLAASRHAAE